MASGVFANDLGCSEFAGAQKKASTQLARGQTSAQRHARMRHADTDTTLPYAQTDTDAHRLTQTRTQTQTHRDTRKDSNTKHGDSNSNSNSNINSNINITTTNNHNTNNTTTSSNNDDDDDDGGANITTATNHIAGTSCK